MAIGTPVLSSVTTNSDSTTATTQTVATNRAITAGSHLVVSAACGGAGVTLQSVSDGTLTWNLGPTTSRSTIIGIGLAVAHCPSGLASGTTITLTWGATPTRHLSVLYEVSGLMPGNAIDTAAIGSTNFTATTTPSVSTAAATAQAEEIIFAAVSENTTGTFTAGTGYSGLDTIVRTTTQSLFSEYQIVSAVNSYTAGFTTPSSQGVAAVMPLRGFVVPPRPVSVRQAVNRSYTY